jgi:hypothetical protein
MTKKDTIKIAGVGKQRACGIADSRRAYAESRRDGYRQIEVTASGSTASAGAVARRQSERQGGRAGHVGQRLGSRDLPTQSSKFSVRRPTTSAGQRRRGDYRPRQRDQRRGNAMAQGKIYIDGDIGARGMTMTKQQSPL